MEEYKNILYKRSNRTKRILINYKTAGITTKIIGKLTSSIIVKNIFAKITTTSFEVYEFFLLELEFILNKIKEDHPEEAIKIGGIELTNLINFLKEKTWLSEKYNNTKTKWDNNRLSRMMKYSPLPHQVAAYNKYEEVKKINNLRGYLLDAEAGAGKTFISLSLAELLDYDYKIIIAPRQVIYTVWVKSVTEELYKQKQSYIVLGENRHQEYNGEEFIIMHYEYLDKLLNNKSLLRKLKRKKPMLIVDEFHNFNEISSQRTQNLLTFVNYINFNDIALLTGTPIKMSVNELLPLLYILDTKFPPVAERFKDMYSKIYRYFPEILRERFGLYKERIVKDKKQMPSITVEEYRVMIPNWKDYILSTIKEKIEKYKTERLAYIYEHMETYEGQFESLLTTIKTRAMNKGITKTSIEKNIRNYKRLVKKIKKAAESNKLNTVQDSITEARSFEKDLLEPYLSGDELRDFRDVKSIMKYPKLKVLGEALGRILLATRIKCYSDIARHITYGEIIKLTDKKTLIFSNYVNTSNIAYNKCTKEGFKPLRVYDKYISDLNETVKEFNDLNNNSNPLIATYKSLSTGVPLIAANVVLTLDLPFRMYILDQAIARAWRLGQDKPVLVLISKLNSGSEFNITDRDNFIINLSEYNVKLITGNELAYEVPKQLLASEIDVDENNEDLDNENNSEEILEEVVINNFVENIDINLNMQYDKSFDIKKIKNMFKDLFKFKFK